MPMKLRGVFEVNSEEDRVQLIADLVEESSQSPYIRKLSLDILRANGVKEKDGFGEVNTIFKWIKKNIQYRGDVFCRDSYHTAERIIELRSGDCDDFVILTDSMLASVGFPIGARIIAMKKDMPFHHIYSLVQIRGGGTKNWYPLDGTDKDNDVGDEPKWARKRDFLFVCGE